MKPHGLQSQDWRGGVLLIALCILPSGPRAFAGTHSPSKAVWEPATISAANQGTYSATLPTGRKVSPAGTINGTPNFPTMIAAGGKSVAILANGDTPFQTITLYNSQTLKRLSRLAVFPGKKPQTLTVEATKGGTGVVVSPKHAGAAGVVYVPKETASAKIANAKAALAAESNPHPVNTTILSHNDLFQGLAAGSNSFFYATGGASDKVLAFRLGDKHFQVTRQYSLQWQSFPKDQYPYQYQGDQQKPYLFYPDSVVVGPGNQHLFVTGMLSNSLARIDLATGQTTYLNVGPYPFAVALADHGQRLVVSDWGANGVTVVDRADFHVLGRIATGPAVNPVSAAAGVHPTALAVLPDSPDVFVADANVDRVVEVDVVTMHAVRTIDDSPYPGAAPGSYPDGLAVAAGKLFVANAGNNDIDVIDVKTGKEIGLIPTAWYPTALTIANRSLYVVSAKGLGSGPNVHYQYIGNMMHGVVQKVELSALSAHLRAWTQLALSDDGFTTAQRARRDSENASTTAELRKHIKYVVFILRENKTFDENFGDYKAAGHWADPHLDLYGPRELPNLYYLAHNNALLVNFMADGEVTAQGHQWVAGASDSDVVQRLWPEYYSNRGLLWTAGPGGSGALRPDALNGQNAYHYYEKLGSFTNPWISYPERLYLFNDLLEHDVSFEDFGEHITRERDGIIRAQLKAHVAGSYPSWDRMILDTYREKEAQKWLEAHSGARFPHFVYIWLPDDHTAGREACYYTPDFYVANNDYATAKLIHYLSTTPEWKHMVVFLTEDDAQSGADHINAHRTLGLAVGPWVRQGALDQHLLSQVNIVKTIEAILGLPPMSQWDQNATVIPGIWANHPDDATTKLLPMQVQVSFNAGKCSNQLLLRREAGAVGKILTPAWLKEHTDPHGGRLGKLQSENIYSPTSILKVPGPEQMRQEWIASKGAKSYAQVMDYLQRYAQSRKLPVDSFLANDGN